MSFNKIEFEDFKSAIKRAIQESGFKSFYEVADELGISSSGFSQNLRLLHKNGIKNSRFACKLLNLLNVSEDEFLHQISSITESEQDLSYEEKVKNEIKYLSEHDTYVLITTDMPWEFIPRNEDFQRTIIAALSKGANVKYIFPSVEENSLCVKNLPKYLDFAWMALPKAYEFFKSQIVGTKTHAASISKRLSCVFVDDLSLISPFHNLIVIVNEGEGTEPSIKAYMERTEYDANSSQGKRTWGRVSQNEATGIWASIGLLEDENNV
jgi:transcriptional regulator with XRE-family HTH domain